MAFLCLWHPGSGPADPLIHQPGNATGQASWRQVRVDDSTVVCHQDPCGVWRGSLEGSEYWLLLDGFVSGAGRCDTVAGGGDLKWLAAALATDGTAALDQVTGQYALCLIRIDTGELIAARDHLGGKSLYWHRSGDGLTLATRSSDLVRMLPGGTTENPRFLARLFGLRRPDEPAETPFRSVTELLPGERLKLGAGTISLERPRFPAAAAPDCAGPQCWVDAFRETFTRAVTAALGESGDVAVMLSGGLDSAPVLQVASEALRPGDRRAVAVSWTLPDYPTSDEAVWIQAAARNAGVALRTFDGGELLPFSELTTSMINPDLPYYNAARGLVLGCHRLAAEASCSVILAGTRGDLLYPPRFTLLADLIARGDWKGLVDELGCLYRRLGLRGTWLDPMTRYPVARHLKALRRRPVPRRPWLTAHAAGQSTPAVSWPPEADSYPQPDHARTVLGTAMTSGTARENDFARRFGVERRDPFHNTALVQLMLQMPVSMSHSRGRTKWVMREAMRGRIPDSIRLKNRTGLLSDLFRAGFERHRGRVREYLLDQNADTWARYVEPGFIRTALASPAPTDTELMLLCSCIGYSLWRETWGPAVRA